jgi:hypothetical protein
LAAAAPEYGQAPPADYRLQGPDAADWFGARFFFVLALIVVNIDALWLLRSVELPNRLAISALLGAVAGLCLSPLSRRAAQTQALSPERAASAWSFLAVFCAFLAFYSVTTSLEATGFNEPVRQSYAYLHGHAWVENVPSYMEHLNWNGRTYLVHPPLSAILLMPAVFFWGLSTNQTIACVIIGALEVALAWRLLGLLGLKLSPRIWLTVFFGAGTTFWYEATIGNSWNFVLVVGALMALLTLNAVFGAGRPWLVGLLSGMAALARNDLGPIIPLYGLILLYRGRRLSELLWMLPGLILAAAIYIGLNELRYGTVLDITLWKYYLTDPIRSQYGPLSIHYLPANLYTLFFLGPTLDGRFPYIHPTFMGQALPLTSPAFVLALRPSFRRPIPLLLALITALASVPSLCWYASGFSQFGTRYYIQVFPFLLALMALGMKQRVDQMSKVLIVVSILLVSFGIWQIRGLGIG